jgi:hypothetical protein
MISANFWLQGCQLGAKHRKAVEFSFGIAVLNENVFLFHVPKLTEPLAKCFDTGRKERGVRPGKRQSDFDDSTI